MIPAELELQIDELLEAVKELKENRSVIAESICVQLAMCASDNYYEGLGILDEAKLNLRDSVLCDCDDSDDED